MGNRTQSRRGGCLDAARSLAHDHEKRRAAAIPRHGDRSRLASPATSIACRRRSAPKRSRVPSHSARISRAASPRPVGLRPQGRALRVAISDASVSEKHALPFNPAPQPSGPKNKEASADYIFRGPDPMPDRLSARKTGRREVSDTAYRDADRRPCFSARGPPVAHQTTAVLSGMVRWRALGRDRRDRRLGGCSRWISRAFAGLAAHRPLRNERRGYRRGKKCYRTRSNSPQRARTIATCSIGKRISVRTGV